MKGAGYSLEGIVSVASIVLFVMAGVTVPQSEQDWAEYKVDVMSDDLTYSMQQSGYMDHALSEGEIGSIQTAFSTVTERDIEVSGLISNVPIAENDVAFYTLPRHRFTQEIEEVNGGCEGDLSEISSRSEEDVLRTTGGELADSYHDNQTLYLGDLDPRTVGGDGETNYDAIWVDRGKTCQFGSDEGPFFTEEIFRWENESYDFKWVNSTEDELRLYRATQPARINERLQQRVNSIKTFVTIDAVNFSVLSSDDYDVAVLRQRDAVEYVDSGNQSKVESFMESGSLLVLANLDSDNFESGDFMDRAGFLYNASYSGGYSGGEINGEFPENRNPQNVKTFFLGLNGEETLLSLKPSGALSNLEPTIQASQSLLKSSGETYDFDAWNRTNKSMQPNTSTVSGAPDSECYDEDSALTEGELTFPDGENYSLINAELGTSDDFCDDNNERGVKVDVDDNGYEDDQVLLGNQLIEIADRQYAVKILDDRPGCNEGECVGFEFVGDNGVEIVSHTESFPEFKGGRMAVTGYEDKYEAQDRRLIAATIHWLRGDNLDFVGLSPPEGVTSSTYSSIENQTFLPYEVNLRWSR